MTNEKPLSHITRIIRIFQSSKAEIRPHFIITGESGSGKTHTISALAGASDIPMVEINAAQLTKEGTSGNSLSKALTPLLQYGGRPVICFVDEWDKLFISGNSNSSLAHETTLGVQNEFLRILEAGTTQVYGDYGKYIDASCANVLFCFAGAFNGEAKIDLDRLREMGVKTEFLGRVGLVYGLERLTLADLERILLESPLLEKYLALMPEASRDRVCSEVMAAVESSYEHNTIGARIINTLIHQYFINGGLQSEKVQQSTFQKTLSLDPAGGATH